MDISTIKQKIAALEAEIVPNSVSPERVASILSDITSLVENMGYLGYEFLGVATPTASPSFDKDLTAKKYFYIAVQQGTYTNFGGLTVGANDGLTILAYNGTWTKTATGTAMKTDITTLQGTINSLSSTLQTVKSDLDTAEKSITTLQGRTIPLSVSFDIDKIDALTDSSGSTDIKAAFTPLSGIGVAPVAGNILRSGNVIKNSQEVAVIWSDYESKTAYYSFSYVIDNVLKIFQTDAKTFVRVAKTIVGGDVGAEIEDLRDRVSIGKAPVWISVVVDNTVGDVTAYDLGTVIWRKDRKMLCEVVINEAGRKDVGVDHTIEDDRIYVYRGNLCKWDGTNFIPFYQEKEEKRYLFKLDLIDSLTTDTDSETAYQSFIPVGETVYKLPTTGDLLGDEENNIYADILYAHYTEAMDEGGITLSYCKDGVVKTIRITGDDYEYGTWKVAEVTTVKLKYKYNLQKIFALSSSSGTEDIEEAFTPTYAPDGNTAMRLPQSGDLLEATNGATSVVLKGLSKSFSFFYGDNRRDITLSGSTGNYKVAVVVTPLDVRVFDLDKLNALTDESSSEDIEDALVKGYSPVPGDLLQGADGYATVLCSDNLSSRTTSFSYITGGKRRTLTISGDRGSYTIKVEEKEVESGGALRITTSKISVLVSGGNGSYDLGVTFQQLQDAVASNQLIMGNITGELYAAEGSSSNINLMSVAYLQNDWRSVLITIPKYSGTTATVTVTTKLLTKFVQIPYSFLSGEIGGTYESVKMPDLLAANIIQTDKGIATLDTTSGYVLSLLVDGTLYVRCTIDYSDNGGLKLTARTETPIVVTKINTDFEANQSQVDIGMSFDELKNTFFVMDKYTLLYYKATNDDQNIIYMTLMPYSESDSGFLYFFKIVGITDAGDGKINITPFGYQYKVPALDGKDKLPAAVMPDSFIAGTDVTAIQTVTELPQSPDSGTLYLIVPSEITTSEEQL